MIATWISPSNVPAQCGVNVAYMAGPASGRVPPSIDRMTALPAMADAAYTIWNSETQIAQNRVSDRGGYLLP